MFLSGTSYLPLQSLLPPQQQQQHQQRHDFDWGDLVGGSLNLTPSPTLTTHRSQHSSRRAPATTVKKDHTLDSSPQQQGILTYSQVRSKLIEPYMMEILRVLIPRIRDPDPRVTAYALRALGELARQSPCSELLHQIVTNGFSIEPSAQQSHHVTDLMHLIIDTLTDYSSSLKRLVALQALALLVQSTGFVIQPLLKYPKLLEILFNIIKTEQQSGVRREVLKLLGVLGALDPHKHRQLQLRAAKRRRLPTTTTSLSSALTSSSSSSSLLSPPTQTMTLNNTTDDEKTAPSLFTVGSEEYYSIVAINALLRILKDPSLNVHHRQAIEAIRFMFNTLTLKMVPFLPQIMPVFMYLLRHCESGFREFLLQKLVDIIKVVKPYIRDYLDELFDFVQHSTHWSMPLLVPVLALIEECALALRDEFRPYLSRVIPNIVNVLHGEHSTTLSGRPSGSVVDKVLHTLEVLNTLLDDHIHSVLPAITKLFDQDESVSVVEERIVVSDPHIARCAIQTIGRLAACGLPLRDYSARILQPLVRTLKGSAPYPDLRATCLNTLCQLAIVLRTDYLPFIPLVRKVLKSQRITHPRYDALEEKLRNYDAEYWEGIESAMSRESESTRVFGVIPPLLYTSSSSSSGGSSTTDEIDLKTDPFGDATEAYLFSNQQNDTLSSLTEGASQNKLKVNFEVLRKAWETSTRLTREDWEEWIRKFSVELLHESPSPALRSCFYVADFYPVVRELFNASFMSCWNELPEVYQKELVCHLEAALLSPTIPSEILHSLLDLAEFMEHDDKTLPISIHTLGQLAEKCRAYAKALHYYEQEYKASAHNNIDIMEALISINNKLGQREAAIGILKGAQPNIELKESWYEKLGHWDKALQRYTEKHKENPMNLEIRLGTCVV